MAGNYPDVPSWRMAYDRDGTQVFRENQFSVLSQASGADVQALNDESFGPPFVGYGAGGYQWERGRVVFIFPEHRDLDAIMIMGDTAFGSGGVTHVDVSTDSTTGLDGTWTRVLASLASQYTSKGSWRTNITQFTALGVKAVKVVTPDQYTMVEGIHMYGEKVPGENIDRLEIWHPALDQKVGPAYLDFGNSARASSATRTFRVKNISPAKTAQQVRVAMEVFTDANPPLLNQMTMSLDGASWLPQVNVGDLAPGQISEAVSLRREMLSNAQLGLWTYRVFAESTSSWV